MSCAICYEDIIAGLKCNCGTVACGSCLSQHLENIPFETVSESGINCVSITCTEQHSIYKVCRSFDEATFERIMTSYNRLLRQKIEYDTIKSEQEAKEKIDGYEREVLGLFNTLADHLNPKCPSCNQRFDDFSGCFSIRCSRCQKDFCGWCLDFFGTSHVVHQHCTTCPAKNGISATRDFYGTKAQFDKAFAKKVFQTISGIIDVENPLHFDVLVRLMPLLQLHKITVDDNGRLKDPVPSQRPDAVPVPAPPRPNVQVHVRPPAPHPDEIVRLVRAEQERQEERRRNRERNRRLREERLRRREEREARKREQERLKQEAVRRFGEKVRRCGHCMEYGHDRRTCPNRERPAQV
ncbi:hypothetical protein EBU94_02385 [bacterium]|nr:hypothetical protein [bacterium]